MTRLSHLALILLALLPLTTLAAPPAPADVSPASNLDENLFLVRALAHEYNAWPANPWDGKSALQFCEDARVHVQYLRKTAVARHLDAALLPMCDDFLTLIDEYETTLARDGEIDDKARKQAFDDAFNRFLISGIKGLKAENDAANQGKSQLESQATLAKTLLDDGLKKYIDDNHARDARNILSKSALHAQFDSIRTFARQRDRRAIAAMTQRYHWTPGEAGFDLDQPLPLADLAKRWPRDPFIKLALAGDGFTTHNRPDDLIARAHLCLQATRLIPADPAYVFYRRQSLFAATEDACAAAEAGIGDSYRSAPTACADEAVTIALAFHQADPDDDQGWVHAELFRAYAAAGQFDDALTAAARIARSDFWPKQLPFAVRYTRILAVTGDADLAEKWLRWGYKLGFSQLKFIRQSPDFDSLRRAKPQAWAELTTLKGTTYISFGTFNDDIVVRNTSPFPMTSIKLHVTAISGGHIWQKDLTLNSVAPHSYNTIDNVFSIPGSKTDHYRWTLECDQGKLVSGDE